MRAAGIDALAAAVAERRDGRAAEQRRQPAGQVAADEVAVAAILGPARRQLREDRRAAAEATLHRVLEVQEAEVVLAPLADDDLRRLGERIGEGARRLVVELSLQRLGVGRQPDRAARARRPVCCGRKVAERLADPRSGLQQGDVRRAGDVPRAERVGGGAGIGALPLATFGAGPQHGVEARVDLAVADRDVPRAGPGRGVLPLRQHGEKAALGPLGLRDSSPDFATPAPAQARERLGDLPRAVPLAPIGRFERRQQLRRRRAQQPALVRAAGGRVEPQHTRQAAHGRHGEARGVDEGEQLKQIQP